MMNWITLLKTQQADFIERLKSGCLLHCGKIGQHSELTIISDEKLIQLRDFCWEMAEKYKIMSSVRDVFINNLKGKSSFKKKSNQLWNEICLLTNQTIIKGIIIH